MVVEQKFKVLRKGEKEIYQNINSNLREIEKNSAEFLEFGMNSHACISAGNLVMLSAHDVDVTMGNSHFTLPS